MIDLVDAMYIERMIVNFRTSIGEDYDGRTNHSSGIHNILASINLCLNRYCMSLETPGNYSLHLTVTQVGYS
jgi:hypothetical protein